MSTNPFDQQMKLPGIKHILAVSSGKGGVGKSTVSSNLAVALAKSGARVGLLDADIYGPSVPRMLGAIGFKPEIGEGNKIKPLERYGVKAMSMGFLVDEDLAIVWRGPMLFKALDQFLKDVQWGELDYLVIDLPPGTGDIQLSLAQKVPISGAVCVTTPQNVALSDVKKAIDMWARVSVPVIGVIENMSYMLSPDGNTKMQLFPKGSLDQYLSEKSLMKLGEIPFHTQVALGGEAGVPVVQSHASSVEAHEFMQVAERVRARFEK